MTGKLLFQGGCHCELVKFEFRSLKKVEVWTCNCSICSLNDYQHLFVRHSDFNLISGKEYLTSYQFATHTAEHLFCRRILDISGIYILYFWNEYLIYVSLLHELLINYKRNINSVGTVHVY